ncbi:MAG: 6-bladed beta-propeller [Balneolaceae bacterium]
MHQFRLVTITAALLILSSCSSGDEVPTVNASIDNVLFEPEVTLSIPEDEQDLFGHLTQVEIDSQGNIFVVDSQNKQIRIYDKSGKLRQKIGGEGSGPGEFQSLRLLGRDFEDELWVYDGNHLRVSRFNKLADGNWRFHSQLDLPETGSGYPMYMYKVEDGFLIGYFRMVQENAEVTLSSMDEQGNLIHNKIVQYVEREMVVERVDGPMAMAIHPIPFHWQTIVQTSNSDRIYVGKTDSLRLEEFDLDGSVVNKIEQKVQPRPVTNEEISDNGISPTSPAYSAIPDVHSAYLSFEIDDQNSVWFNLGTLDRDGFQTWIELNENSGLEQAVSLPVQLNVQAIRRNKIYGIYRDEDGVQSILVLNLL